MRAMTSVNDIPELYRRFDGDTREYQELRRRDLATQAEARWPLIAAIASAGTASAG